MFSRIIKTLSALCLICLSCSAFSAQDYAVAYQETLDTVTWQKAASSDAMQKLSSNEQAISGLKFDAFGRRFDLALSPNHALMRDTLRGATAGGVIAYRGTIAGMPSSWARIVVKDNQPSGLIWDGQEFFAIEWRASGNAAVFRLSDLIIEPGALGCGFTHQAGTGDLLAKTIGEDVQPSEAAGATEQIQVAVIADSIFSDANGANTEAEIIARMNIVDGIFSEQVGVQLTVALIDSRDASDDPFSSVTDSGDLLDELSAFRNNTASQHANGLSHLFTGRDLDGTTVGIAYRGALCSRRFGTGLTQATRSTTMDALIAAHEFGHNFGAPHDGTEDSACETTPQDFLMAPRLNGSDTFSTCSLTRIAAEVQSASCVTSLPTADVSAARGDATPTALLGDNVAVDFEVNSSGSDTANGVRFAADLPDGVTLTSVATTQGSCSSGAQSVDCNIGDIVSGSGVTVTLSVSADAVGDQVFSATVSATSDANANNNAVTETLTVDPLVDVLASSISAASVTVDEAVDVRAGVENLSEISATDIVVTIDPDAGLRIDNADWSAGTCTVSADGAASCEASSIAPQSVNVIDLQLTGTATGNLSYQVNVSAAETERNTTNNATSGSVTVNAVNTSSGGVTGGEDSGGGSIGWLSFLGLGLLTLRRRRTH